MSDYISREALLERIDGIYDCADMVFEPNDHCCRADDCASCKWRETKAAIRKIAANIPAADVRENKRGHWNVYSAKHGLYSCSKCYSVPAFLHSPFCPNCGADMREATD